MCSEIARNSMGHRALELECLEERVAPAGSIFVVLSGGNVVIAGDDEANSFVINDDGLAEGQLRIAAINGTTIMGGANPTILNGVTGGIKINLGDGDDFVLVRGAAIEKNLQINGGEGIDVFTIDSFASIGGSLALTDVEDSTFNAIDVGRGVSVTYTADGQHRIEMIASQIGGGVSIATRGMDMLSHYTLNSSMIAGAVTVSNKAGAHATGDANSFMIIDSTVGAVKVKAGTGDYVFNFRNSATTEGKGGIALSYGVGDVAAVVNHSTVNGAFSMKTGGGLPAVAYETNLVFQNTCTIDGKLTVRTFDTDDSIVLDNAYVVKGLNINTGTGELAMAISKCSVGGERMGEKVVAYTSTIAQTASGWSFEEDVTSISVSESELGALSLKLRSQEARVLFSEVGVVRNLSVSTGGADDMIAFRQCRLVGNVAVKTAGGNDAIALDWVDLHGGLLIDSGDGNDRVALDAGCAGKVSDYVGSVKISLGAGDDILQMGNSGPGGNIGNYAKSVTLNGGAGADLLDCLDNGNTFAVQPKYPLFETTR